MNVELLEKIREQIIAHPEQHDQQLWGFKADCGTTHCIAGWAAVLTGQEISWCEVAKGTFMATYLKTGESIANHARRVMGPGINNALFYMDNEGARAELDALIERARA